MKRNQTTKTQLNKAKPNKTEPVKFLLRAVTMAGVLAVTVQAGSVQTYAATSTKKKIESAKEEAATAKKAVDAQKKEVNALKSEKKEAQSLLDDFNDEMSAVTDEITKLEAQIADKQVEVDKADAEYDKANEAYEEAKDALDEAEADEEKQYSAMKKRVQYLYEHGGESYLLVLLNDTSHSNILDKQEYIQKLEEYDKNALEEYMAITDVVEEAAEEAEAKRKVVLEKKDKVDSEMSDLEGLWAEQDDKKADLEAIIASYTEDIKLTESQIKAAEEKAAKLQKELDKKNANVSTLEAQLAKEQGITQAASSGTWTKSAAYSASASDRKLMATIIFCEAGNQCYEGQVAVGAVVMNRVRSSVCPNTIAGVIYQSGQFEPVMTGRFALALARNEATDSCYRAADAAMAGENPIGSCLFFRTPVSGINYKYKIQGHIFY